MMVPGGIYSLIMFATAGVFMWFVLRRARTVPIQMMTNQ